MDQFQENFGSDEDSIAMEVERGDAVIVYGCNDQGYSPLANHVTKVIIGHSDPNPCLGEVAKVTNEPSSDATFSGNANHKLSSSFDSSDDRSCMPLQTQVKPYQELAETLSHLTEGSQGKEQLFTVSPALSRKFRDSLRTDVSPPSKNPFLTDANAAHTNSCVFSNGDSPRNVSDLPNRTAVKTEIVPLTINHPETNPTPLPGGSETIIDPPGAFQSSDLLGNANILTTTSELSQSSSQTAVATTGLACTEDPVSSLNSKSGNTSSMNVPQTAHPDVTIQPQQLNAQSTAPLISNSIQSDPPKKVQIVNTSCSQELPPIQESLNTPDQSKSSFHFPEPPRPEPLVCIPVKEVKFEEPQKYQIVAALENAAAKLGEIVPITVQPCQTTQNIGKATDEPNVIAPPTYSTTQFQPKGVDGSNVPLTIHENNSQTALKINNIKTQETEIPTSLSGPEENEHSYGIIGNEDNLSEITLPPLAEGNANNQDHDTDVYNNGHPHHRIRISIDHQAATPSRRTTVITVLLVILLMSAGILLGVYKFVNRSSPN